MSSEKSGTATFDWYAIDPYSNIINLSTWGNFTVFDFKEDHNIVNPPS
jgi:hypothetical protein